MRRNLYVKLTLFAVLMLVISSCRKNTDIIEERIEEFDLGFKLNIEEDSIQYNANGMFCEEGDTSILVVSNNPDFMTDEIYAGDLENGDFWLFYAEQDGDNYGAFLYVTENEIDGNVVTVINSDQIPIENSIVQYDTYATGGFFGYLSNGLTQDSVFFTVDFTCLTEFNASLCD